MFGTFRLPGKQLPFVTEPGKQLRDFSSPRTSRTAVITQVTVSPFSRAIAAKIILRLPKQLLLTPWKRCAVRHCSWPPFPLRDCHFQEETFHPSSQQKQMWPGDTSNSSSLSICTYFSPSVLSFYRPGSLHLCSRSLTPKSLPLTTASLNTHPSHSEH